MNCKEFMRTYYTLHSQFMDNIRSATTDNQKWELICKHLNDIQGLRKHVPVLDKYYNKSGQQLPLTTGKLKKLDDMEIMVNTIWSSNGWIPSELSGYEVCETEGKQVLLLTPEIIDVR